MRGGPAMSGGGGGSSFRSSGPSVGAAPMVRGNSGAGVARNWQGGNRQANNWQGNNWQGNNWQGNRHHHGNRFRGGAFVGAYAYTYPYYDDGYYGYDRCAYVDPNSWWWQRYCGPYYGGGY
jgi:hypothetical protein